MAKKTANAKKKDLDNEIIDKDSDAIIDENNLETDNESVNDSKREDIEEIKNQLRDESKKSEEYLDRLHRTMAEFENYKKRTLKEKESLYNDAVCDMVSHFIIVLDNLERAIDSCKEGADTASLLSGVEMVHKQFKDELSKIGVEDIQAKGEKFDPEVHNAVMHVEDDSVGENVIIEEFQKGYKLKDKVIRHSMVKVAN